MVMVRALSSNARAPDHLAACRGQQVLAVVNLRWRPGMVGVGAVGDSGVTASLLFVPGVRVDHQRGLRKCPKSCVTMKRRTSVIHPPSMSHPRHPAGGV
jgi:hypothetical protein